MAKKDIVDAYKEIRLSKRYCLVDKANKDRNEAEKVILKEMEEAVKPIRDQIHDLNTKLHATNTKYQNRLQEVRSKYNTYQEGCPDTLTLELRKFDRETNKKVLDFLNGVTDVLTEE